MAEKIKLQGAAKKVVATAKVNAFDSIKEGLVPVEKAIAYGTTAEAVIGLLENGQEVVLVKVKDDPHTEYPATLKLVKYNTLNKITAVDEKGGELALIRSERGKKNPRVVSNYFRVSNSAAYYFPEVGMVADAETED